MEVQCGLSSKSRRCWEVRTPTHICHTVAYECNQYMTKFLRCMEVQGGLCYKSRRCWEVRTPIAPLSCSCLWMQSVNDMSRRCWEVRTSLHPRIWIRLEVHWGAERCVLHFWGAGRCAPPRTRTHLCSSKGWSIACQRCTKYIFIIYLTPGLNGLAKDNCNTRWETSKI